MLTKNVAKLNPKAALIIKHSNNYTVQTVDYAPELLNLGVILLGYYHNPHKVQKLSRLGDCLSVAHYLSIPQALKYGRDFTKNSRFQQLSSKTKKHLTNGIQDGTNSFSRDLSIKTSLKQINDLNQFLSHNSIPYVYLYENSNWQILRANGHNLTPPVSLQSKLEQLLSKKA